jgi:hypothetical protein
VIAGRTLTLPPGTSARLLSDPEAADVVDAFVVRSPDHTVYHRPAYIDFARRQNGAADVVLLSSHGQPLVALPFHPGPRRVSTGYAGACFPPDAAESTLRRAAAILAALARANPGLRLQALQSAQAAAVDDRDRAALLAAIVDALPVRQERLHTRVVRVVPRSPGPLEPASLTSGSAHEALLSGYDPDLRNQVRQAIRRGVTVSAVVPASDAAALDAYREFLPIHVASWTRTGMTPHRLDYLLGLEAAVRAGGGHDLVVMARAGDGRAVAAVSCHVHGERAIYWSGASLAEALPLRANPLCLHAAIGAAQAMGVRDFELGRFRADERDPKEISVTRYKAQFGGRLVRVLNFEFNAPRLEPRAVANDARRRVRSWLAERNAARASGSRSSDA